MIVLPKYLEYSEKDDKFRQGQEVWSLSLRMKEMRWSGCSCILHILKSRRKGWREISIELRLINGS